MNLQIISPEAILYEGNATSIVVPGLSGDFEILKNHVAIVSILKSGKVRVKGTSDLEESFSKTLDRSKDENQIVFTIASGTIEVRDNNVVLVVES